MNIDWRETLKYSRLALIVSTIVILLSLGGIIYRGGLLYGIDFTGGFQVMLEFARPITTQQVTRVREMFESQGDDAQINTISLEESEGRRGMMITVRGQQIVERLTDRLYEAGRAGNGDIFKELGAEDKHFFLSREQLEDNFQLGPGEGQKIDITRAQKSIIEDRVQSLINSALSSGITARLRHNFTPEGEVDLNWAGAGEIQKWLIEAQRDGFVKEFAKLKSSGIDSMEELYPMLERFGIPKNNFEQIFSVGSRPARLDLLEEVDSESLREIVHEEFFAGRYADVADKIVSERNSRSLFSSTEQVLQLPVLSGFHIPTLKQRAVTSPFVMIRSEMVSPAIGSDLIGQAALAILISLIGILAYLHIRFEFTYSLGAIAAIIHDIIVTVGLLTFFGVEFDVSVVAAVLTVIGYSLNDTIVNFDRVRENRILMGYRANWYEVINRSVYEVLNRTIVTSLTTFLAVFFLYVYGGIALRGLSITLLIGVVVGTYSSIFISNVVLQRIQQSLRST